MRTGALIGGRLDDGKVVRFQGAGAAVGAKDLGFLCIVTGVGYLNDIGIVAGREFIESCFIVNGAAIQDIFVVRNGCSASGDGGSGGAKTRVDIDFGSAQGIVRRGDGAGNREYITLNVSVGQSSAGQLNIVIGFFAILRIAGINIPLLTVRGFYLIEDVVARIHIQTGRGIGGAIGGILKITICPAMPPVLPGRRC